MDTLLFGTMGISAIFSALSFGGLAIRRTRSAGWGEDRYFWICSGVTVICVGLLWFAMLRTYQSMVMQVTPFVQNPSWALTGVAVLCAGLACLVRAKSLSHPHIGRLFIWSVLAWSAICTVWKIM